MLETPTNQKVSGSTPDGCATLSQGLTKARFQFKFPKYTLPYTLSGSLFLRNHVESPGQIG